MVRCQLAGSVLIKYSLKSETTNTFNKTVSPLENTGERPIGLYEGHKTNVSDKAIYIEQRVPPPKYTGRHLIALYKN